jgi:hypothetical protein
MLTQCFRREPMILVMIREFSNTVANMLCQTAIAVLFADANQCFEYCRAFLTNEVTLGATFSTVHQDVASDLFVSSRHVWRRVAASVPLDQILDQAATKLLHVLFVYYSSIDHRVL